MPSKLYMQMEEQQWKSGLWCLEEETVYTLYKLLIFAEGCDKPDSISNQFYFNSEVVTIMWCLQLVPLTDILKCSDNNNID